MTKEELAAKLNNREYLSEITSEEKIITENNNLVVIYGYSDDTIELVGAIYDEINACDGTNFRITKDGVAPKWDDIDRDDEREAEEYFRKKNLPFATVKAEWDEHGYSWFISANISFAPFDIVENGEKYCRGIVINLNGINS